MKIHYMLTLKELEEAVTLYLEDREVNMPGQKIQNLRITPTGGVEFDMESE